MSKAMTDTLIAVAIIALVVVAIVNRKPETCETLESSIEWYTEHGIEDRLETAKHNWYVKECWKKENRNA